MIGQLLDRLQGVRKAASGWTARCPAHRDKHASLSLAEGDDGKVLVKCFAGCQFDDIAAAIGVPKSAFFGDNGRGGKASRRVVATYDYTDENGKLLFQTVRYEPKDFRQRRPGDNGTWAWSLKGIRRVLYRLPELLAADPSEPVMVVEGEKDADRLRAVGLVATCNPMGAGKWRHVEAGPLHGRRVVVVPDNDPPGRRHAEQIAQALHGKAASVKVVSLPDLPEHGDVSDWLANGGTAERLRELVEATPEWEPTPRPEPTTAQSGPVIVEVGTLRPTQGYASERFVAEHGQDIRFCKQAGQWLIWDGRRWAPDVAGGVFDLAKQTVLGMYAAVASEPDPHKRADLTKLACKCDSDHGVRAIVSGAEYLNPVPVRQSELDADPWLLCVSNGTLDLRSGELRPHRRDDLITKLASVEFVEAAEHELWDRFLRETTDGDTELAAFLQRAVGYSLTGCTSEEKLFFVHGPAAAGKTTFIEAIKAVLGDYATTADFETFLERKCTGGPRADIARLAGSRFVASVEVSDGRRMAHGLVKVLVGGDTVAARHLYQDTFEFAPTFKLWLAANATPNVADDDSAMWRRILRVPFEHVIPKADRDPSVKAMLRDDPEARTAVLAWAVGGCLAWQQVGLRVPESVEQATEAYRQDQDPLREFFEEVCVFGPTHWTGSKRLRQEYLKYAEAVGVRRTMSPKAFVERIKARGCRCGKDRGERGWWGIGILDG